MKNFQQLYFIIIFISLISSNAYSPVVNKLKYIVDNDPRLKMDLEDLFRTTPSKFWENATLSDFYSFFNNWLSFSETPDTVSLYIDPMYALFASTGGRKVFQTEPMVNWTLEFMLARGKFMDSPASNLNLTFWLNDPKVKINDYIIPPGGFISFNDFFTRQIKRELRPVNSSLSSVVSPSDGYIWIASNDLNTTTEYQFKNDFMSVQELLNNDPIYKVFEHGTGIINYLGSTDYHHFWSPVYGRLITQKQVSGFYIADGNPSDVANHRRALLIFDSPKFGYVAMVVIGMYDISSINLAKSVGDQIINGEELGNFAYGGSEIVMLFQKGKASFPEISSNPSGVVNIGQTIGFCA